jgi:hypothetical protein
VQEHERPEQFHRLRVELRLPLGQRGAELQVARTGRYARLIVALALLVPGLLLRRRHGAVARRAPVVKEREFEERQIVLVRLGP